MKASRFPRIYRAYDLDKSVMLSPEKLASLGMSVAPDGLPSFSAEPFFNIVVMWFSGKHDKKSKPIFEGDICKMSVKNEFGSFTVAYGVMRWVEETNQFVLQMNAEYGGVLYEVVDAELIGNEFENPELVSLVPPAPNGK